MSDYEQRQRAYEETGRRVLARLHRDEPDLLRARFEWKEEYRQVDYRIVLWDLGSGCDGYGTWNYYLYLREQQFGCARFEELLWLEAKYETLGSARIHETFDYYRAPFTDLDLHGGITHYARHGSEAQGNRCVEAGCDYAHAWDRDVGYDYDLRGVRRDAQASIDRLHELFPDLLVRCCWDGIYHPRGEMLTNKNGGLVWEGNRDKVPAEWEWFRKEEPKL